MRHLFLMLVLVNLGFAAWSAWVAPSARGGRPADEGLPALTLVSEVPADLRTSVFSNGSRSTAYRSTTLLAQVWVDWLAVCTRQEKVRLRSGSW